MNREEWLKARMSGIGGSEVAAIFGASPWDGPHGVWMRKKKLAPEKEDNERFKIGRMMESPIAQLYADREGVTLEKIDGLLVHPTAPIVGTPDRIIKGKRKGVEIKTADPSQKIHWGEAETDQVPVQYVFQCATYMLLTGFDEWDLAVLFGMNDFRIYRLKRDAELEKSIIDKATEFWNRYVVGNEEPPVDGSESCSEWIGRKYPVVTSELRDATDEETAVIAQLGEARISTRYAEAVEKELENKVKDMIGESEGIWSTAGKITWKKSKDTAKVDWESAAQEILAELPAKRREEIITRFTMLKEGSRRFNFQPPR